MNQAVEFRDRMLSLGLARVSEAAALASAGYVGRGDQNAADQAAVDAMRGQLNMLNIDGMVVIGEGERDQAPMLYSGERVGTGDGPSLDIALDPLEGTALAAKDMPNALTVIAMGPRGSILRAPDVYMDKLAIGPGYPERLVTLEMSPRERVERLAAAKGCRTSDIAVCVLERQRHEQLIEDVRATGAAIRLISDGDVAAIIHCTEPGITGLDMYMGIGGAPEGVLAAAALKCMGGQMEGKLLFDTPSEQRRAGETGITDLDRVYTRQDMINDHIIFAATGVTDGSLLKGIRRRAGFLETETVLLRSRTGSRRTVTYRQLTG